MEALLSPDVLAEMRRLDAANLPHTCTVETPQTIRGAGGKPVTTWLPQRILACRFVGLGGSDSEQVIAGQADVTLAGSVIFEAGATIEETARLLVTGLEPDGVTPWGKALNVVRVGAPKTYEMRRQVFVQDLNDDAAALATLTPGVTASVEVQPPAIALVDLAAGGA